MKLSRSEADLSQAQELFLKPLPKPAHEEIKAQKVAEVHIPQPVKPVNPLYDESLTYFGASKTLRTHAHRNMVMKFVKD